MTERRIEAGPNDVTFDAWRAEDTLDDLASYGRGWNDRRRGEGRYIVPAYLSGSDYSGSLVELSNYRVWCEEFASGEGQWWVTAPGGHGTYAIVIDSHGVPDDLVEDVERFLGGLYDYPLASEDDHSRLEAEKQTDAWVSWAAREFERAICKQSGVEFSDDGPDADRLYQVFCEASDRSNTYWENQSGTEMWIDVERVARAVTEAELADLGARALDDDAELG